jgi:hypothetical protein
MRWLAALALASGCTLSGNGDCRNDLDCDLGAVCANTRECVAGDTVHYVRLTWTIGGLPADPRSCAPIPDLEVAIADEDGLASPATYAPVPCALGQYVFDKLPLAYDRLSLEALSSGERHSRPIDRADEVLVEVELESGDTSVPDAAVADAMAAVDAMPPP